MVRVSVTFFSYFKDLAGCGETVEMLPAGATIAALLRQLYVRFPQLEPLRKSTLVAVGMDYQDSGYVLCDGDAVSLFPPVQGG